MSKKAEYFSLIKTRLYFLLIILSFAGPLILASFMYKYSDLIPVAEPKSNGNLINPVITISEKEDFDFHTSSILKLLGMKGSFNTMQALIGGEIKRLVQNKA